MENKVLIKYPKSWGLDEKIVRKFSLELLKKFGFGKVLGIDLPAEANGFIPTPQWKQREKKDKSDQRPLHETMTSPSMTST